MSFIIKVTKHGYKHFIRNLTCPECHVSIEQIGNSKSIEWTVPKSGKELRCNCDCGCEFTITKDKYE